MQKGYNVQGEQEWSEQSSQSEVINPHTNANMHSMSNETILNQNYDPNYVQPMYDPNYQQNIVVVPPMSDTGYYAQPEINDKVVEYPNITAKKVGPFAKFKGLIGSKFKRSPKEDSERRDSRNCCCRKRLLIPLSIVLVIIIGLAILGYLIFPSPPSIEVGDPVPEASGFLINGQPISSISGSILEQPQIALSIALSTLVTFNSSSLIPLGISKIDVTVVFIN